MQNVTKRIEVVGKATGVNNLKKELEGVSIAQDKVAASGRRMTVEEQKIEAANLRLVASNQKLAAAQSRVNSLMAQGPQPLAAMAKANAQLATAEAQVVTASANKQAAVKRAAIATAASTAITNADTAATKANAMAKNALASSSGAAAFRQRQLAVQSLDVAQSLALGMPPMMVAIQQGGQLAGIYAGQGGLAGAAKEAASSVLGFARANPVMVAATVAAGVAFAGLTYEINQTTDVAVGMGHVFQATMIVARDAIGTILAPAVAAIGPYFGAAWDGAVGFTKSAVNTIIGAGVGAYKFIVAEWRNLPATFADIGYSAANGFLKSIDGMIQSTLTGINVLTRQMNAALGTNIGTVDNRFLGLGIDNPFEGAANATVGVDAFNEAFNFDYVGAGFDAIRSKAIEFALAGEDGAKKVGKGAKDAADKAKTAWANAVASIKADTNQLIFDANSIGMPQEIATQLSKEQELINAAIADGKPITAALTQEISALASAYADAEKNMSLAESAQKAFENSVQFARDVTGGFISDLKSGLKSGEGFWDSFKNAASSALDKIADKLLNNVLDAIFQVNNASSGLGGGGFFQSLIGGVLGIPGFAGGGSHRGGLRIVGENGPELEATGPSRIYNAQQTQRMLAGNNNQGSAVNQNVHVTTEVLVTVDDEGKIKAYVTRESQQARQGAVSDVKSNLGTWSKQQSAYGRPT